MRPERLPHGPRQAAHTSKSAPPLNAPTRFAGCLTLADLRYFDGLEVGRNVFAFSMGVKCNLSVFGDFLHPAFSEMRGGMLAVSRFRFSLPLQI